MKVLGAILAVVFLQIVGATQSNFQVPEPLFQVFSPRGLRVSVPDSREIKSVEFFLNVPSLSEALIQEVNRTNGGYWIYWNPDVVVDLHDKIRYKLMVKHGDLYCQREGVHVVQKVVPLIGSQNASDCTENQGQKIVSSGQPRLEDVEEHHFGKISSGKTSNFKSSYSMQKKSDLKPITKSSTSTTSGTFYVKPSGVMEATGYKKESSFDSTKKEGEQWKHYEAELTAAELENMRQLYGSGLYGYPQLTSKLFPNTAKMYEKSYMSSESQSFPSEFHRTVYGESPVTTHQFHQTHKTHESSSVSHSKPVFQYHFGDSSGAGGSLASSRQFEKFHRLESLNKLPNPLPPQGTMFSATEYVREEHTVPEAEVAEVHVDRDIHSGLAPQKIVQVSQTGEYSSHNQEIVKPVFTQVGKVSEYSSHNQEIVKPAFTQVSGGKVSEYSSHNQEIIKPAFTQVVSNSGKVTEYSSQNQEIVKPVYTQSGGRGDQGSEFSSLTQEIVKPSYTQTATNSGKVTQLEYNSGNLQTVDSRQDYRSRHYVGNIFTTVNSVKPKSPQECTLVPGVDYTSSGNVRELEKFVFELSCLATLAESSVKEEIALLKQKNSELSRKFELLEHEVKRLSSNCNCY